MFWNKKKPNDLMLDSVREAKNYIQQLVVLQAYDHRFTFLDGLKEDPTNLKKTVAYIYYDYSVVAFMPIINENQQETVQCYLRDAALAALERVACKQFRTHAAEETNFRGIESKPKHSNEFLDCFKAIPVFRTVVFSKLEGQRSELIGLRTGEKEYKERYLEKVKKHLGDLVSDEDLLIAFKIKSY
jgi:hypothetical protein